MEINTARRKDVLPTLMFRGLIGGGIIFVATLSALPHAWPFEELRQCLVLYAYGTSIFMSWLFVSLLWILGRSKDDVRDWEFWWVAACVPVYMLFTMYVFWQLWRTIT